MYGYFQRKLMTNYTFKHVDFEKAPQNFYKFTVWQSVREKGPAFWTPLKMVENLRFCSRKDIFILVIFHQKCAPFTDNQFYCEFFICAL